MKKSSNINISAVFMFTDIVGYSSMVSKDENSAINLLEDHDNILIPSIKKFNGKIVKHLGDGIFAYFDNAENALDASLEFQIKINKRNQFLDDSNIFQLRVGIHKGNCIIKNDDLFGHDINLASRIEGVSVLGGIAISEDLRKDINLKKYYLREIGYVKLKNINLPLLVHNIYLSKENYKSQSRESLIRYQKNRGINLINIDHYQIANSQSLGIINFKDNEDNKFSDNLSKVLINDLGKINDIRTPSISNTSRYLYSNLNQNDLARKLKVNNLLSSEITIIDKEVILHLVLYNNIDNEILVNRKLRCKINDLNFIRIEVLSIIMNYFNIKMPEFLLEELSRKMSNNSDAIEKFYKGKSILSKIGSMDDINQSMSLFKEAIDLDDNFIEAKAEFGLSHRFIGEFDSAAHLLKIALKLSKEQNYSQGIADVYEKQGILYSISGKLDDSLECFYKAVHLQKKFNNKLSQTKLFNNISESFIKLNQWDDAFAVLEKSKSLKVELELEEMLHTTYAQFGNLYKDMGDYSKAIENYYIALGIEKEYELNMFVQQRYADLIFCYTNIGSYSIALKYLDKAKNINENFEDNLNRAIMMLSKAKIQYNCKGIDSAIDCFEDSIEEAQMQGNTDLIVNIFIQVGLIYLYSDNYEKSRRYITKALKYAKKIKDNSTIVFKGKLALAVLDNCLIDDFKKELFDLKKPEYYEYWYIASFLKDADDEISCICKSLLLKESDKISNDNDRESYLDNIKLNKNILSL